MFSPYGAVATAQAVVVSQCVKSYLATVNLYAGLLDPRPDLAIPARSVRVPYAWWW